MQVKHNVLMTHAFDGSPTPVFQYLPCGSRAMFDSGSGMSYRCEDCMATVGSIGMPSECRSEMDKYEKVLPALGSKVRWDYEEGCEKVV
jgi:hypothetical protein